MAMTKTSLDKNQALDHLMNLFKHFQDWIKQPKDPTLSEIEKVFTHDFQLSSNGLLISKNISDQLNRLIKIRKKYSRVEIEGPREEIFVKDHQAVVYYTLHFWTHAGQEKKADIMAIAVIEDHKIKRWTQVAHEQGKDWDS